VAYVKYRGETCYTADKWKELLRDELPSYMIPGIWIAVEKFTFSVNGKIDRMKLPEIGEYLLRDCAHSGVEPRSGTEYKLREIWREVLHQERIGVDDSFFDLGGNSLNIVQLASHYYRAFGKKLTIEQFFTYPTISAHAALLKVGGNVKYEAIGRVAEGVD